MDEHPTKAEKAEINELCCAIGHVIVQWGFVEHNLYICLAYIYHNFGGNKITKKPKIEKFTGRQIAFLRECFNKLDSLTNFKSEGLSLLDRVATLAIERDDIIHSTYGGSWDSSFKFYKFSFREMVYIKKIKRTLKSVLETRKKIEVLAADIVPFGLRLAAKKE